MNRFSIQRHYPAMQPLVTLGQRIHEAGRLESALIELVLMRVSQINGCAFCLDMHSKDARAAGETEQRLYLLPAWRETTLYSERERIAFAWAEELTELPSHESVSDALYAKAREHFDEDALVDLTLLVVAINSWNRINIAARTIGGNYKPVARKAETATA
ncbi:carboxymuconolactone decarboxylase family protein [Lysobacter sp. TY2-98]|uniref:carboxymuconolactone decarboxylase family protein n=1 Tax=Lysobacter sp. TY2-98 TaxID=2290922 RepID=UPI000E201D6C|nr:carboxymuconolactone decarboxylase family protein [Lysobacter sp. TY2-98]AXK72139.1 carboxymuconolactone decarboxylase family protein [Lysobacter sp. TY2-98]